MLKFELPVPIVLVLINCSTKLKFLQNKQQKLIKMLLNSLFFFNFGIEIWYFTFTTEGLNLVLAIDALSHIQTLEGFCSALFCFGCSFHLFPAFVATSFGPFPRFIPSQSRHFFSYCVHDIDTDQARTKACYTRQLQTDSWKQGVFGNGLQDDKATQ